jgi:hypothetical protein
LFAASLGLIGVASSDGLVRIDDCLLVAEMNLDLPIALA